MSLHRARRECLRRWWPDQVVGAVAAVCAMAAIVSGSDAAIDGVGLSTFVPDAVMWAWFAGLFLAGVALVVATELDYAHGVGCSLIALAVLLGLNGSTTAIANQETALGATIGYISAAVLALKRAQDAGRTRLDRQTTRAVVEQALSRAVEHRR